MHQAAVMALQQANQCEKLTAELSLALQSWIDHILLRKIKFGKTKIKAVHNFIQRPPENVLRYLVTLFKHS